MYVQPSSATITRGDIRMICITRLRCFVGKITLGNGGFEAEAAPSDFFENATWNPTGRWNDDLYLLSQTPKQLLGLSGLNNI